MTTLLAVVLVLIIGLALVICALVALMDAIFSRVRDDLEDPFFERKSR